MHGAYIDMETAQVMYEWQYKLASYSVQPQTVYPKSTTHTDKPAKEVKKSSRFQLFFRRK